MLQDFSEFKEQSLFLGGLDMVSGFPQDAKIEQFFVFYKLLVWKDFKASEDALVLVNVV